MDAAALAKPGFFFVALAVLLAPMEKPAMAEMVGRTAIVVRDVTGELATTLRRLSVRDEVNENETVATAEESASEILFLDGTTVALGPKAQLVLDNLVYDPRPSRAKLALRVVEGAFRFVTGGFSSDAYTLRTPTATIGVRGTSFGCVVRRLDGGNGASVTTCAVEQGTIMVTDLATGNTVAVGPGRSITVGGGSGSSAPGDGGGGGDATQLASIGGLRELDALIRQARLSGAEAPWWTLRPTVLASSLFPPNGLSNPENPAGRTVEGQVLENPSLAAQLGNGTSSAVTSAGQPQNNVAPGLTQLVVQTLEAPITAVASPSGLP